MILQPCITQECRNVMDQDFNLKLALKVYDDVMIKVGILNCMLYISVFHNLIKKIGENNIKGYFENKVMRFYYRVHFLFYKTPFPSHIVSS